MLWFGPDGRPKNWDSAASSLTCFVAAPPNRPEDPVNRHVLLMLHAEGHPREFVIPALPKPIAWRMLFDTRQPSPNDIYPNLDGPTPPPTGRVWLDHHTMMGFVLTE